MEDRQLVNKALMLLETGQVDQAIETVSKDWEFEVAH
jgi:hypothetical protein